jgi:ABC-type Na+ efflux pump permease subunit
MGKNETRRLNPSILAEDLEIFAALKTIANYTPANSAYTVAAIGAIDTNRMAAHDTEMQATAAADAARDDHVALQWDFHNGVLGAKNQVIAQFGLDSNEAQAMKLKKKSEYKNPTRKTGGGSTGTPPAAPKP